MDIHVQEIDIDIEKGETPTSTAMTDTMKISEGDFVIGKLMYNFWIRKHA